MKSDKFLSLSDVEKMPVPDMSVPGVKVRLLESWRTRLQKAVKELGYTIEMFGYEDGSTVWAVAFEIDQNFDIRAFKDDLRNKLNFGGWLQVAFFDLAEE